MKNRMRKILAALSAMVMLLAVVPVAGLSVTAATPVVNATFEDGGTYFSSSSAISAVNESGCTGSYCLKFEGTNNWANVYKGINVTANTEYVVTFKMKSNMTGTVSVKFVQHDWSTVDAKADVTPTTSWAEYSVSLSSKTATDVLFMFQLNVEATAGQIVWFDDIVLTEKVDEPEPEPDAPAPTELIPDGGFENGIVGSVPAGWDEKDGTVTITADAAHGGAQSLLVSATWNYATNASVNIQVEPDTAYAFTFYYSSTSATAYADGWAKIVDNSNESTIKQTWMNHNNALGGTTWRKMTMDFTTGSTTSVRFELGMVASNDDVLTTYYVDDIECFAKPTIENGDFETGAAGGSLVKTSSNTKVTNEAAYEGNYSLKLDARSGWSTSAAINVSVVPNTDYVLTLYYSYVSSSATNPVVLYFYDGTFENATYDNLSAANGGKQITAPLNDATAVNGTTWAKKSITFNSGANSGSIWVKFSDNGNGSSPCYIDKVTCRKNVVSNDGYIKNGDFENDVDTSWTFRQSTKMDAESAYKGESGAHLIGQGTWGGLMDQTITVEAGKTYVLSFWLKAIKTGVNVQFKDQNSGGSAISGGQWFDGAKYKNWTLITLQFTAVSNAVFVNFCGAGGSGTPDPNKEEELYVDNVSVVELKEPSYDGYVYDGDFEAGILIDWTAFQGTALSADAAHSGEYGVNLVGAGGWGSTLSQDINTIPGLTYEWSFWVKVLKTGNNFKAENGSGETLGSDYIDVAKAGDWTKWTITFTATSGVTKLNICGSGEETAESLYLDDVTVTPKMEDIVSGGQTSVSEDVSGLQFKFDVMADGVQVNDNQFIADSGSVMPYYNFGGTYTLVAMGAVVTNKSEVGTSLDKMVLDSVDGSNKVINIPVVYLHECQDSTVSFAVRVTNIPENKYDARIYARAYFVFDDGYGNQITVYDSSIFDRTYNEAKA